MSSPKVFELRAEYKHEGGVVVLEIFRDGCPDPKGMRSVPLHPNVTYSARLAIARAWLASVVGVDVSEVRGA